MRSRWVTALTTLTMALGLAGCGGPAAESAGHACERAQLPTLYRGILTFATDQPAYPPWYIGDDPANGEGFESALAYALAGRLGYTRDDVRWVRVPFNTAMTPGPKSYDAGLSEFSITDQRRELVDFTSPYYDVAQAVVTVRSSPAATVTTLSGLRALKLGAQVGTTSSSAARAVGSYAPIAVYNSNIDAKIALRSGEIDALVLDLPTALSVRDELDGGIILGRLPAGSHQAEQLGVVLDKDSPLTGCLSAAVDGLRADGTLAELERRWLAGGNIPPELS